MAVNRFKVIKGGVDLPPDIDNRRFRSAYATNTRLMGVLGVRIHWEVEKFGVPDDMYQFFYLDAEEYALENYVCVHGNNQEELLKVETSLIGGLGGEKVELTERDCCCLLSDFAAMNKRLKLPLPEPIAEYGFMLRDPEEFTQADREALMAKICTPLQNYFELVHYFLMRTFGHDYVAAKYLTDYKADASYGSYDPLGLGGDLNLAIYDKLPAATLFKDTIDIDFTAEGNTVICESLLETGDQYVVAISRVTTNDNMQVVGFECVNSFRITSAEAAMQLAKGEFMTIYEILVEPEEFESFAGDLLNTATISRHENGKLYMLFHKNNNHVQRRIYRLNDDVDGVIYVSDYGQVLAVAYDIQSIRRLEYLIGKTPLKSKLFPVAKYEFKESILFDFMQSGYEDFNDFLEFIRDPDHE